MKNWFEVDKAGLGKLMARRSKSRSILELVQNAWDENVAYVDIWIGGQPHSGLRTVLVRDDNPKGFARLTDAFTLFAESSKKGDPTKRGRFNLGEKLVLAICKEATITTTTGTVHFNGRGRTLSKAHRAEGTQFEGLIPMTIAEEEEALRMLRQLIPPKGVRTDINRTPLPERRPIATFEASLPTEIADREGFLHRSTRKCRVEIYEPQSGEVASIYEMGIPVVETGDRFHVNVMQKVPLNMDRDNVPPAYLKLIRTLVLNQTHGRLNPEETAATWVSEAIADPRCNDAAVRSAVTLRFGDECVAYDPSDREANGTAAARGRTVVPGGAMSKGQWDNARRAGIIPPAGRIFPTPKPYSDGGEPLTLVPEQDWDAEMHNTVQYVARIAQRLIGRTIGVRIANEPGWRVDATFGRECPLTLNLASLGRSWFHPGHETEVDQLLIHELAHEYSADHLSHGYHEACCRLGAKLKRLALDEPDICRP